MPWSPKKAKAVVFSFFILSILLSIVTVCFSFSQVTDSDELITEGGCDVSVNPFRAVNTVTNSYIECSWNLSRSFVRIVLQFLNVIAVCCLFVSFHKGKSFQFFLITLFLVCIGIAGIYSFGSDANSLINSLIYCNSDKVYFLGFSQDDKSCEFARFYLTLAFNVLTTISIVASSITALLKRSLLFMNSVPLASKENKLDNHHHPHENTSKGYESI